MSTRFRSLLLLALLLIVPLQGMAAVLHSITCAPQADHAAAMAAMEHGDADHEHGMQHKHPGDSKGDNGEHSSHQCCHHLSAVPAPMSAFSSPDLPVLVSSVSLPALSFVLEQPQRPPRT